MRNFPDSYPLILETLKNQIRSTQLRALLSVNTAMLSLYWHIGRTILDQQQIAGWGGKVIEQLSLDLRKEFPDMQGISPRNLKYMRKFAESYPDPEFVQRPVAQLSWGHHCSLMDRVKTLEERLFYMQQVLENGWSREMLNVQIQNSLFARKGKSITNFQEKLPEPQSALAQQTLKDPYIFDFLTLASDYQEKDLENALIDHITKFLLELGTGFAYVGKQYHLEVGENDFYLDLLFYHLKLRCYVVIELKRGRFEPEHAGKLNFYLSVVDDKLRHATDQPSIGLLICQDKNQIVAEYALKDINKPIGISEYKIIESIPENLKGSLPTIAEIERELSENNSQKL